MELFSPDIYEAVVEGKYSFSVHGTAFKTVVVASIDPAEKNYRAKVYRVSDGLYLLNERIFDHYKDEFIQTLTRTIVDKGYA